MRACKIIDVAKSRELEQRANDGGLSFADMMENAGRLAAEAIDRRLDVEDERVLVLVGPGNNGGDGLVAAHYLAGRGARVTCYVWQRNVDGDANWQRVQADGLPCVWAEDDGDFEALRGLVGNAFVVVDALLGVGVSRPIDGLLRDILAAVRGEIGRLREGDELAGLSLPQNWWAALPFVAAVDCPTGLNCDTGALDDAALPADMTVTFAYPKVGLLRFPGAEAVGEIVVADIGIPPDLAADVALELATPGLVRAWLPRRPRSAHKGTFGRALIVAGSVNYVGAAALAGMAAARVGTGLVTMAVPPPIQPAIAAQAPELTYLLVPHDMGVISSGAVGVLRDKAGEYEALLLGPGLTQEKETVDFVRSFLGVKPRERKGRIGFAHGAEDESPEGASLPPLVVDADALNALASDSGEWWKALPPDTILTPHPGEMARLMGGETRTQDVQADREGVARRMAAEWGSVLVLKGAFTVIAAPDGRLAVLPFANAGLATAGSGDVLAGAIVGLRAQGLGAFEAAVCGAFAHGLAGELVAGRMGDMGMVAGDLPGRLPEALARIRRGG